MKYYIIHIALTIQISVNQTLTLAYLQQLLLQLGLYFKLQSMLRAVV